MGAPFKTHFGEKILLASYFNSLVFKHFCHTAHWDTESEDLIGVYFVWLHCSSKIDKEHSRQVTQSNCRWQNSVSSAVGGWCFCHGENNMAAGLRWGCRRRMRRRQELCRCKLWTILLFGTGYKTVLPQCAPQNWKWQIFE